ncbi:MAG: hypothetical protein WDN25_02135 [Acetobacteraceae bacterium]
MTKVAVLDDWQGVAKTSADWSKLQARAEVVFFAQAFANEDDAAAKLADFDIVLSMRERTPPARLADQPAAEAAHAGDDRRAQCLIGYTGLHRARHRRVQHHGRRQQ